MQKNDVNSQKGSAVVIGLVALVIVAVGALGYLSIKQQQKGDTQTAQTQPAAGENKTAESDAPKLDIKPGNPVVGKLNGKDINRSQVLGYMQTLPANMRQIPFDQLFPLALDQMINAQITNAKAEGAKLDDDPAVKQQLEAAKANIVRNVFIQKEIEKGLTEEKLRGAYEEYAANYPEIEERKARHIMVKDKALAKDLIKQLKDGGDFVALAQEHSIDGPTKEKGGEIGFISEKSPVLPEFIEAVFDTNVGSVTSKPVETEGGFHVVEVLEQRNQPPQPFENVTQYLAGQLSSSVLNETLDKWREQAGVEVYGINGKEEAIEPAAGADEKPTAEEAAPAAEAEAPKSEDAAKAAE